MVSFHISSCSIYIKARVRRRQRASYPIINCELHRDFDFDLRHYLSGVHAMLPNTSETPTHYSIILACTYLEVSPSIEPLRYASCAILVVSEGMHEALGLNYYADSELHCAIVIIFPDENTKMKTTGRQEEGCFTCAHVNILNAELSNTTRPSLPGRLFWTQVTSS